MRHGTPDIVLIHFDAHLHVVTDAAQTGEHPGDGAGPLEKHSGDQSDTRIHLGPSSATHLHHVRGRKPADQCVDRDDRDIEDAELLGTGRVGHQLEHLEVVDRLAKTVKSAHGAEREGQDHERENDR